jgi:hypothetical protein
MTVRALTLRLADELHKRIARLLGLGIGARLVRTASAIDLARGDAGEADARTLGTPDRAVAVPHACGSARESLAGRDYRNCGQEEQAHTGCMAQKDFQIHGAKNCFPTWNNM